MESRTQNTKRRREEDTLAEENAKRARTNDETTPSSRVVSPSSSAARVNTQRLTEKLVRENVKNIKEELCTHMIGDQTLVATNSCSDVCEAIAQLIHEGKAGFPFKKFFISNPSVLFQNLRNFQAIYEYDQSYRIPALFMKTYFLCPHQYKQRSLLWPSEKSDYDKINVLSDYFQEKARVQSVIRNQKSTMDVWKSTARETDWLQRLVSKGQDINSYELREALYNVSKGEPTTFKATVAKSLFMMMWSESQEPLRILDFCSGWGDRLLGALACHEHITYYYGIDPNDQLFEGYSEMKNSLAVPDPDRFHMVHSPFESWEIPSIKFNLIFTGPPYFDYETYGDGNGQSTTTFTDPTEWIVSFLFFSIWKSWAALDENGVMALNVNDTHSLGRRRICFTEAMVLFAVSHLEQCSYQGVICFTGANYAAPRPIWVFKKNAANMSKKEETEKLLKQHYPDIWKVLKEKERKW